MNSDKSFICNLTPYQKRRLKKLRQLMNNAYVKGKRGVIILQPWGENNQLEYLRGGFVPQEQAEEIMQILLEINE